MATAFDGRPAGSWQPVDFQFHPYDLTAERLTTLEPAACPKRKAGRQKRTSIQCQVSRIPHPRCSRRHPLLSLSLLTSPAANRNNVPRRAANSHAPSEPLWLGGSP